MNTKIAVGMEAPDFRFHTLRERERTFHDGRKGQWTLLVFLRYVGCPLCQMKIGDLMVDGFRFQEAGIDLLVVLQSPPETVRQYDMAAKSPLSVICDPDGEIYRAYGVKTGSIFRYITPGVLKKATSAKKRGIRHGKKEGKELQLPAIFIVDPGIKIAYAAYGKHIGDVPVNEKMLEIIATLKDG